MSADQTQANGDEKTAESNGTVEINAPAAVKKVTKARKSTTVTRSKSKKSISSNGDITRRDSRRSVTGAGTGQSGDRQDEEKEEMENERSETLKELKEYEDKTKQEITDLYSIPEWKQAYSKPIAGLVPFDAMSKKNIKAINDQFKEFAGVLEQRRQECVSMANRDNFASIQMDVVGTKLLLSNIGSPLGENHWKLQVQEELCVDKSRQILHYEQFLRGKEDELIKIRADAEEQRKTFEAERQKIDEELSRVKPLIEQAAKYVREIQKSALDEFRALRKPSPVLVDAVRATAIALGRDESSLKTWIDVKKNLTIDFINSLLNFDAWSMTDHIREILKVKYLSRKDFTYERINKANAVAGPFVFWLRSQVEWSRMLQEIAPLQQKIDRKETQLKITEFQGDLLKETIEKLKKTCEGLHDELASILAEINTLSKTIDNLKLKQKDKIQSDLKIDIKDYLICGDLKDTNANGATAAAQ